MINLPSKYLVKREIDPGQNAKVFLVQDQVLKRDVFIKTYPIKENEPLSSLVEARLLVSLSHPNLVKINNADFLDDHVYLDMELLEDGSLKDLIERAEKSGTWPSVYQVLHLFGDIARGLSELHRNRIVHRDIKPANIMVKHENSVLQGVITDLGLASLLDDVTGRTCPSKHANLYRPPEVWEGKGYSPASDIYQAGIVLYQLLGGGVDYSLSGKETAEVIVNGRLLNLSTLGPHADSSMRGLIKKCVCPEADRLRDTNALIEEIGKIRKKHLNWRYKKTTNGFQMRRIEGNRQYKVTVKSEGTDHFVEGMKKVGNGEWRRFFKDSSIKSKDVGRCQLFRKLVAEI